MQVDRLINVDLINVDEATSSSHWSSLPGQPRGWQMLRAITAGVAMLVAGTGAALAQQAAYTWTGKGQGSGNCMGYTMKVNVTVDGTAVKGVFQQEGRPERQFVATLGAGGAIKTQAKLDSGDTMDVKGTIKDGESRIVLDGY